MNCSPELKFELVRHGARKSWESARARCGGKQKTYKNVSLCDRWSSFEAFFEDMGPRPPGKTLERIDGRLGYEPGNCCWATRLEQARNRKNSRKITVNGESLHLKDWCKKLGLNFNSVATRLRRGWDPVLALTEPKRKPFHAA